MIEITAEQVERVNAVLGGLHNAPNKVFHNVINRALSTVRSQSGKRIAATYQIKQSEIKRNSNMRLKRATAGDLAGQIEFAGTVIPLMKFKVSPKEPRKKPFPFKSCGNPGGSVWNPHMWPIWAGMAWACLSAEPADGPRLNSFSARLWRT